MTVGGQLTEEVVVSPARSKASALTTLKVEPGANWPTVAADCPLVPVPLAAASMAPSDGRMATMALAGLVSATSSRQDPAATGAG